MSELLDYYKNYYKNNGIYQLEDYKDSSRVIMITTWLKDNLKPGAKVLDIGCGDGSYSKWMPEFEWTGIDINEEQKEYNGTRLVHDLEKSPYDLETSSFDAVICSEVLEHLWTPENVHKEVARVLKPKSIYIISTPNYDWIEHHLSMFRQVLYSPVQSHLREHIRFYNYEVHQQMLDKAGFTVAAYAGADLQFSRFFEGARILLRQELPNKGVGEVDYLLGQMFPLVQHTIGILAVKR